MSLEQDFDQHMLNLADYTKQEVYNPTAFRRMVLDRGGLATARDLITSNKPSDGYTNLYLASRLNLTVEAQVYDNKRWHPLFHDEEIELCRKRLVEHEYDFSGDGSLG